MLNYYTERSFTQVILLNDTSPHTELFHNFYLLSEYTISQLQS